ncbi:hypothetical protein GCM10011376_30240 [Nocardioides flavus (ex Wang et al. 2016)]|uniref:4-amino-4-deoxy-L-arabinose transferase n=1 Tax=Nocardioides flavus (ex Wang et al. 2016) TaxID=2058780 RepID=A0ABQ3HP69_9ACTN|nr:hypothetical protein GCM10011376_30240 [Nocardioides flavus (ex Wang et al. 2016)]
MIAAALVLLQAVVRGWVVSGSYYFQDDFAHLDLARRSGLTSEYLVRDYGGHFEVGQYFLLWVMSHTIDQTFAPAAFAIVIMQAVASVLLFILLRTLFGPSPFILLPWTVYLFTPLAVGWSSWLSAAMQALPLQIATALVLIASAKAHKTGSRAWATGSVAAFAVGLLMWQKAGLILPLALAVHLLVVADPQPWRERLRGLRRTAGMWVGLVGVLTAYIVVYLNVVDGGLDSTAREGVEVGPMFGETLFRMFVPGLFGGPWHSTGAESTIFPYTETYPAMIFSLAFLGIVVASFMVTGRRALQGWFLLVGYLVADLALLGLGRADWIGILLRDPRYVADALPVMTIAVLAAFRGLWEPAPDERKAAQWLRSRMSLRMTMNAVAVLIVSCLVTTVRMAPVVQHDYAANYALGVARQMKEDPRRSVINTAPPFEVSARADLQGMMNAIGADVVFDRPATDMYLFDGLAQLKRMDLFPGSPSETGPQEGCGWSVGRLYEDLWAIDEEPVAPRILRMGYYSGVPATLDVSLAERTHTVELPAGLGQAFFVIGPEAGDVAARVSDGGSICITDVAVGPAWVADEAGAAAPAG